MDKKFLKEIRLSNILEYMFRKSWIVFGGAILAGVLIFFISSINAERQNMLQSENANDTTQYSYVLIDGNYVYTTLISIRAESTDDVIGMGSYLSTIISHSSISAAIETLGLQENYIDIFNKMSWEILGETIRFKISSPLQEVDGYTWEQVLAEIVRQGEISLKEEFENVNAVNIIDEPYLENAVVRLEQTVQKASVNIKVVILGVFIVAVLICAGLLIYYLLKEDISCVEEIENNLEIPVLVVVEKKSVMKS